MLFRSISHVINISGHKDSHHTQRDKSPTRIAAIICRQGGGNRESTDQQTDRRGDESEKVSFTQPLRCCPELLNASPLFYVIFLYSCIECAAITTLHVGPGAATALHVGLGVITTLHVGTSAGSIPRISSSILPQKVRYLIQFLR